MCRILLSIDFVAFFLNFADTLFQDWFVWVEAVQIVDSQIVTGLKPKAWNKLGVFVAKF